jgi:hypothetical protein
VAELLLLDTLLTWCRDRQLVKARGRQRTDSTHILAAVRALKRLEAVGDTLRHALNTLAVVAPAWLRTVSEPDWQDHIIKHNVKRSHMDVVLRGLAHGPIPANVADQSCVSGPASRPVPRDPHGLEELLTFMENVLADVLRQLD